MLNAPLYIWNTLYKVAADKAEAAEKEAEDEKMKQAAANRNGRKADANPRPRMGPVTSSIAAEQLEDAFEEMGG